MNKSSCAATLAFALIAAALAGCGESSDQWDRVPIQGVATYGGQPIQRGRIRFTPSGTAGGPVTVVSIENGAYLYDLKGGLPIGTHRVQVWALDPNAEESPGPGGIAPKPILPEKYNNESTMEVTVDTSSSPFVYDLNLD